MKRLFVLAILLMLAACTPKPVTFVATDITGADFNKPLNLTDHFGKKRTMSDFKGKIVVLFFGYTHCPDVCPTTMVELKNTMKLLGDKADEVQVLFVTVDPQRDTQEVLSKFVPSFDKRFIGLWGSLQETAETMAMYKIFYAKVKGTTEANYTIDHSAGMYIFDQSGNVRLYVSYGTKAADIASDIKRLL